MSSPRVDNPRVGVSASCPVKAKFHYAVQLASRSQASSRPNRVMLSSLRAARELVADMLASRIA